MLPKTIYEYAGAFDRYGIKQKYINPEDTDLALNAQGVGWGLLAGPRIANGVNVFLKRELLPIPETPLVFSKQPALPWLRMSEGLSPTGRQYGAQKTKWISTGNKVKFYMAMDKEPKGDWELTLKGFMFDDWRSSRQNLDVQVYINNREIGTWQIDKIDTNTRSAAFTIPQFVLEESFKDETRLVTIMLRLQGIPSQTENSWQPPTCGIQLEELLIRPKAFANSASKRRC